jgi:hypothetical protein
MSVDRVEQTRRLPNSLTILERLTQRHPKDRKVNVILLLQEKLTASFPRKTLKGKDDQTCLRAFDSTDTRGAVMELNYRVLEKVAFSAVVLSALSCLGIIIREKFPGVLDLLPRGHDVFLSEYALACLFPSDCEQLLDHLKTADERSAAALVSERPE